jgi:hypothetical protein
MIKFPNAAIVAIGATLISIGVGNIAEAATVTYNFRSVLNNNTYGTGSFSYDSSLGVGVGTNITNIASLISFSYSDPTAGSFTKTNLGSFQFVIGTTPTTSAFAFVTQSADGLRSFTGGVVDANNVGGLSTSDNLSVRPRQTTNPSLRFPTLATAIPTPALLPGLVGFGIAALRKRERQSA